jgi:succinyl-CoA synthetase alpha subunit
MTKPVVAFVAGASAPRGRRMGHPGAVISGDSDTATAKLDAMEALGLHVVRNPAGIGQAVLRALDRAGAHVGTG